MVSQFKVILMKDGFEIEGSNLFKGKLKNMLDK